MGRVMNKELFSSLRSELKRVAVRAKAPDMQRYMKSEMPYHGVPTPAFRLVCKKVFSEVEFSTAREWERMVWYFWKHAEFREERYAALYLCSCKQARAFSSEVAALEMYRDLAIDGAWWDYVDGIAGDVSGVLREHFDEVAPVMRKWSKHEDMWVRRLAILSQLNFKKDTDLKLLYDCIKPSFGSREFFLQKAIGWALRQYAWVDAKEVKRFVVENKEALAPLSKREALKNVKRGKC